MQNDYYAILDISPKAEQEVVDGAYRRLALKFHPTINASAGAYERMKEINEAWEVLSDPARRASYDRSRLYMQETRAAEAEENPGFLLGLPQFALAPRGEGFFHPATIPAANLAFSSGVIWRVGIGMVVCLSVLVTLWAGQSRLFWIEGIIVCACLLTYSFFSGGGASRLEWVGLAALSVASVVILVLAFPEFKLGQWLGLAAPSGSPNVFSATAPNPSATPTLTPDLGCPGGCMQASFACMIKAHIGADGKRSYYLLADQPYDEVIMDSASSDRWFCSEAEAAANGWVHYQAGPVATPTSVQPATLTPVDLPTLYVCAPIANVRSGAGLGYPIVNQSPGSSSWNVLGKVNDWYYVEQGDTGQGYYIHESMLCSDPSMSASASSTSTPVQPTPDSGSNNSGATANGFKYQAPRLVGPPDGTRYQCTHDLQLEWTLPGSSSLADNEWFLVESKRGGQENWFGITEWTKSQSIFLHPARDGGKCDADWWPDRGAYEWRVVVVAGDISGHILKQFMSPASSSLTIQY